MADPIKKVKTILVYEGKNDELETLFFDMVKGMQRDGIDAVVYDLYKSQKDSRGYMMTEHYNNEHALIEHEPKIIGILHSEHVESFHQE